MARHVQHGLVTTSTALPLLPRVCLLTILVPMSSVKSQSVDPCHEELQKYSECVKRHPKGLKETDCEDVKAVFKKCMKDWKTSRTVASYLSWDDSFVPHFQMTNFSDFPPFYTLQLNPATRQKQLSLWSEIIGDSLPGFQVSLTDRLELFRNKSIGRELDSAFLTALCEYLVAEGLAEWLPGKQSVLAYKRSIPQWAALVHAWAVAYGKVNSIESAFSIAAGDDSKDQPFHGIPNAIILRALKELESQKKCELIFQSEIESDIMTCGVKFFP